jgi:hypothetical protein
MGCETYDILEILERPFGAEPEGWTLSPSAPKNPFRHGTQKQRLLDRLREGPASSIELALPPMGMLNYTGRISEVRKVLHPQGFDIKAETAPGNRSHVLYSLVRLPSPPPEVPHAA